ncbi:uncharacterized protein [Arachis hypogaea]|uniref:uncharacterized protein isoform X1 n=1 Tax=Arachis hypogaea TaxID=3818 RepID=UPI0007AFD326|nr:uncharacterized protein LOC112756321 isoform X1 [Arachis hypogaea]QHN84535.1 uncharacterized protein DS421_16g529450 [Arachis hypogaea]
MDCKSDKIMHADNNQSTAGEDILAKTSGSEITNKDLKSSTRASSDGAQAQTKIAGSEGEENHQKGTSLEETDVSGDVNMEASITTDDVIRAGGFGARDDISSFLPVAIDSTDFEASIRDARDYEEPEPQGEVSRPGLGWTGATKGE